MILQIIVKDQGIKQVWVDPKYACLINEGYLKLFANDARDLYQCLVYDIIHEMHNDYYILGIFYQGIDLVDIGKHL